MSFNASEQGLIVSVLRNVHLKFIFHMSKFVRLLEKYNKSLFITYVLYFSNNLK
jgi:hypothetical protein